MPRLSHLFEGSKRETSEPNMESSSPQISASSAPFSPQSPHSAPSSVSASPATSLFSTRTHNRFPSSGSSLASSPGVSSSTEAFGTMKTHLAEVKEEPQEREATLVADDNYFAHFNDFHAVDNAEKKASMSIESYEYDLSTELARVPTALKKRRSDNSHFRGISRISTRLSSMSSKWKQKQQSDTAAALERYDESLRSRASSTTSTLVSPPINSLSRRPSRHSQSPPRTVVEERRNEPNVTALDIDKANEEGNPEPERHATTPLLPPMMVDFPNPANETPLDSPLQSPTVADASDSPATGTPVTVNKVSGLPSPPISSRPSMSSIHRQVAPTRGCSMDIARSPMNMEEPVDEWSHKLGHANFTILPEPYSPAVCNIESLKEHQAGWELARCNFAKHLVRTGEHYGITSHIYKLTEEKWESVNDQWRLSHNHLATNLADGQGNPMSLRKSNIHTGEAIKIPRLHDKKKFPDLGDEDIVGPMTVAPQPSPSGQEKSRKRSFFKFLQDIFC